MQKELFESPIEVEARLRRLRKQLLDQFAHATDPTFKQALQQKITINKRKLYKHTKDPIFK